MDLLVIKNHTNYVRIEADRATVVGLDKASVFPVEMLDRVTAMLTEVRSQDCPDAAIYRLSITETPL